MTSLSACQRPAEGTNESAKESIVIGFSQSGTESSWRKRHTESIRTELEKEGYEVLYRNGYMNQERQIQDIRSFIVYQVDAIVFTPLQEDGWEPNSKRRPMQVSLFLSLIVMWIWQILPYF